MNLRKIKENDVSEVSSLIIRNFDEVVKMYHSNEVIEKFKGHNTPHMIRQQMMWKEIMVVEENNIIIATGAVADFGNEGTPKYSVSNFFVKPELHRKGIGSFLFDSLLKIAISKGAKTFHVPSSRNAVGFYEKMGFVKDEIQPDEADEITWLNMKI